MKIVKDVNTPNNTLGITCPKDGAVIIKNNIARDIHVRFECNIKDIFQSNFLTDNTCYIETSGE